MLFTEPLRLRWEPLRLPREPLRLRADTLLPLRDRDLDSIDKNCYKIQFKEEGQLYDLLDGLRLLTDPLWLLCDTGLPLFDRECDREREPKIEIMRDFCRYNYKFMCNFVTSALHRTAMAAVWMIWTIRMIWCNTSAAWTWLWTWTWNIERNCSMPMESKAVWKSMNKNYPIDFLVKHYGFCCVVCVIDSSFLWLDWYFRHSLARCCPDSSAYLHNQNQTSFFFFVMHIKKWKYEAPL